MGVQLAKWALSPDVAARGLSSTARLVLVAMCFTAQDRDTAATEARLWWGGHESLMIQLAGDVPDDERERAALARRIKRAISELVEAGAIVLVEAPGRGRRAIYRIESG